MVQDKKAQYKAGLADQWHLGLRALHKAHALAATRFERRGRYLGIPVVLLTALVGTGIFATLDKLPDTNLRIATGLLAALASILSALQTFLNYSVLAEKHRSAEVELGMLRRDFERRLDKLERTDSDRDNILLETNERWNRIEAKAPIPPNDIYKRVLQELSHPRQATENR